MRAEILLWYCLARRQYGTVSVTADWNVLQSALWGQVQHVCTEHLIQRLGREGIRVEMPTLIT